MDQVKFYDFQESRHRLLWNDTLLMILLGGSLVVVVVDTIWKTVDLFRDILL